MSEIQDAVIQGHLRTLKMPGIRAEYTQIARQAREDSWSYEEYLRELLDTEIRYPANELTDFDLGMIGLGRVITATIGWAF